MVVGCRHVNHHPPSALAGNRILVVELQVELQHVDLRLADKANRAAAAVLRHHRAYLIGADVPGLGHPGNLDVGISHGDVRVQAAAARGDGVGGHCRVGGCGATDGHDLADRVVLAVLGAFDPYTLVDRLEGSLRRLARLVHADHPGGVDDIAAGVAGADHRQHRAHAAACAERT